MAQLLSKTHANPSVAFTSPATLIIPSHLITVPTSYPSSPKPAWTPSHQLSPHPFPRSSTLPQTRPPSTQQPTNVSMAPFSSMPLCAMTAEMKSFTCAHTITNPLSHTKETKSNYSAILRAIRISAPPSLPSRLITLLASPSSPLPMPPTHATPTAPATQPTPLASASTPLPSSLHHLKKKASPLTHAKLNTRHSQNVPKISSPKTKDSYGRFVRQSIRYYHDRKVVDYPP